MTVFKALTWSISIPFLSLNLLRSKRWMQKAHMKSYEGGRMLEPWGGAFLSKKAARSAAVLQARISSKRLQRVSDGDELHGSSGEVKYGKLAGSHL